MPTKPSLADYLLRRLNSIYALDEDDIAVVDRLPIQLVDLRADEDIIREGDRPTRCCFIVSGMTCWFKITGKGQRQILSFHVVGDLPDLQSIHLSKMDSTLSAVSPCRIAFVPHHALHAVCEERPKVASALWRMTLIDAAVFREWVANVGGRQAYARMAHLLCEMTMRLGAVGLAENYVCNLPITQGELADATGMSTVHVNRTLQALRRNGLVDWRDSKLTILDWPGLQKAGDFDPGYLHLRIPPDFKPWPT